MKGRLTAAVLIAVLCSACASGEGPHERSGERAGGRIGAGIGAVAGGLVGAATGNKGVVLLGAGIGAVAGGLVGAGIGGGLRSSEDPKLLCGADGKDRFGDPCLYDTTRGELPITHPNYGWWWGGGAIPAGFIGPQRGRGYYSPVDCEALPREFRGNCRVDISREEFSQKQEAYRNGQNFRSCGGYLHEALRSACEDGADRAEKDRIWRAYRRHR